MKIKIKYLLSFLIIGIGLLFNQSFARTLYVDTSAYGGIVGDRNSLTSAMYKRTFKNTINVDTEYSTYTYVGRLGYSLYYNGTTGINIMNQLSQDRSCPTTYSGIQFNSSIYSYTPYNWSCYADWQNVAHYDRYYTYNYKPTSQVPIQILLGRGSEFGNVFIGVQNATAEMPIYGFGKGFANNDRFTIILDTDTSYLRLFGDINVSNNTFSFDNYDPITMSGPYMTGINAREYFYPRGTRTNYGYIVDDGNNNRKFKHFGLYDMGYSYVYGQWLSESASSITRNKLKFVTVEDNIEVELKDRGDIPYSVFQEYSYPGLLLLKGTSYSSMGNDKGAYILSKDPSDPTRILYEHWSCNFSSIRTIFSGGNDLQSCLKLDGGYLSYNNSTSVLPFTDFNSFTGFNKTGSLLLYDLMYGSDGTGYVHGESEIKNGKIYFNGTSRGYGFVSNDSVNLQELYLNGGTNESTSSMITSNILARCINDFNFQMSNPFLCSAVSQNLNTAYALGTGQYYQYTVDSSGNVIVEIIEQAGLFDGSQTVWLQDGSGNWVTNCSGGWCNPNSSNVSGSQFLSGDILVEDYYSSTGLFFKCPYPYETLFTLGGWDLRLGRFDIIGPINCFISAFKHGQSFNFLDNVGLYDFGPLIVGDTNNHKILFRFFDFLLIMWFIVFFTFIYKRFK